MMDSREKSKVIDRFVQSVRHLGLDLANETESEQGCEPQSTFDFLSSTNCSVAGNYYRQQLLACSSDSKLDDYSPNELQIRNRIKHFVAAKADLIFKLNGTEKLRNGIDFNASGCQEAYSFFAANLPPLELAFNISPEYRKAHMFQILKVGDLIVGEVVGKRPFGIFVRIKSLVFGRNLDFEEIDVQAMCHKSELARDHKAREHFDPIDDFEISDLVRGVITSLSAEDERIAISFRRAKIPEDYGNIELGIIEETDECKMRGLSFNEDQDYNHYLNNDLGFSNPTNVQTLINVLGIRDKTSNSLLCACQHWSLSNQDDAATLRKKQSLKWSMERTASGVESLKSGDHVNAMRNFDHALKIYEENAEALVARGALYANQNKLENAIKDFRQALVVHPRHHNAHKYLKETLFAKAVRLKKVPNVKEALVIFHEVLRMDPDHKESQDQVREIRETISKHCVENESKGNAGSSKQGNKFDHVRKLIEADPQLAKTKKHKKGKKKKKHKVRKNKKKSHHSDVSSSIDDESTRTASENENNCGSGEYWVEKEPSSSAINEKPDKREVESEERYRDLLDSEEQQRTQGHLWKHRDMKERLSKEQRFLGNQSESVSRRDQIDVSTTEGKCFQFNHKTRGRDEYVDIERTEFEQVKSGNIPTKEQIGVFFTERTSKDFQTGHRTLGRDENVRIRRTEFGRERSRSISPTMKARSTSVGDGEVLGAGEVRGVRNIVASIDEGGKRRGDEEGRVGDRRSGSRDRRSRYRGKEGRRGGDDSGRRSDSEGRGVGEDRSVGDRRSGSRGRGNEGGSGGCGGRRRSGSEGRTGSGGEDRSVSDRRSRNRDRSGSRGGVERRGGVKGWRRKESRSRSGERYRGRRGGGGRRNRNSSRGGSSCSRSEGSIDGREKGRSRKSSRSDQRSESRGRSRSSSAGRSGSRGKSRARKRSRDNQRSGSRGTRRSRSREMNRSGSSERSSRRGKGISYKRRQ